MTHIAGLTELLATLNAGEVIPGGSAHHEAMHATSQEALRITAQLNGSYQSPEQVRALLSELTGTRVPDSMQLFPPFLARTSAKTSVLVQRSSSTVGAVSKTRAALASVRAH